MGLVICARNNEFVYHVCEIGRTLPYVANLLPSSSDHEYSFYRPTAFIWPVFIFLCRWIDTILVCFFTKNSPSNNYSGHVELVLL